MKNETLKSPKEGKAKSTQFQFATPAKQVDFPNDPAKQKALNTQWNNNLNGFTQQGITGNPWNSTNAASITNYFNPINTPIPSDAIVAPITWNAFPGRIGFYFPQLSMEDILSLADTGYMNDGKTSFPNITQDPCSGQPINKAYGPYGPRGWQDEYCEWAVTRNASKNITRIDFTCENPEYWNSLRRVSKFDSIPINGFDSANTGQAFPNNAPNWLGAQNGTNVWYEVKLNKDIYTFVVQNKYYNAQYQELAVKNDTPIVFPKGVYGGAVGAIELKAAWMEVTDAGNTRWNRYKLSNAVVVDANSGKLRNVTLALVGLHILHKTQKQPTWVWATFEQVDNVPGSPLSTGPYNFYNPHCASQKINVPIPGCLTKDSTSPVTIGCIPNRYPAYYLCKNGPGPVPIQVTRTTPLDATVSDVNKQMQAFIAKNFPQSVWQYYQLVNVIWSTNPTQDPTQPVNVPLTPQSMQPNIPVANTVLETYIQNTTCTSCHTFAAIAPTSDNSKPKQASDFSFAIKFASYPKTAKPRK